MDTEFVFRVPEKRRTSAHYAREIRQMLAEIKEHHDERVANGEIPTMEEEEEEPEEIRECTSHKQLFEDDNMHFDIKLHCRQIFLGNQQIPARAFSDFSIHFVIDPEPRLVLTLIMQVVSIPIAEVMAIAFYKTKRIGFNHVMIVNLTAKGSTKVLEKYQSLKYRLGEYRDNGMTDDDISIQRNTLFVSLGHHDETENTKIGILSWLENEEKSYQIHEGTMLRVFKCMKEKLERNCMVIEIIIEELNNYDMEDIMDTLGLSWLKTGAGWQVKDRCHLLNMIPTMFMERTSHGVCELMEPEHLIRPLARKRMLSFNENAMVGERNSNLRRYSVKDRRASVMNNQQPSTSAIITHHELEEDDDDDSHDPEYPEPKSDEEEEAAYTVTYVDFDPQPPTTSILASLLNDDPNIPSTSGTSSSSSSYFLTTAPVSSS